MEVRNVFEGLEDILLHACGFGSNGKTKSLLHRNHYVFGESEEDQNKIMCLELLGVMTFSEKEPLLGTVTRDGIFHALKIASFRTGRMCCYNCSNMEWIASEDEEGYVCSGKAFKNNKQEDRQIALMDDDLYLYRQKKCYQGVFRVK